MIIKDVVNLARYSELSGVAIKDNIEAIVAFINLGMLEIYTRFTVKVKEHRITVVDNQLSHDMPADFMYPTHVYKELEDNSSLKNHLQLPINDVENLYSIHFNDWSTAQIPEVPELTAGSIIVIMYATKPTVITVAQANDGLTELALPDMLVDALLSYIGYRGYLGVRVDGQSENNAQWNRFERNCNKALENGVAFPVESLTMTNRIGDRGFA